MSIIFQGLRRLSKDDNEPVAQIFVDISKDAQIFVGKSSRLLHVTHGSSKDEHDLFTKNQMFVNYSQKKYVLENVIHFVPKIVFFFKVDYAVQISIRFIVKQISGTECQNEINNIISSNPGISEYFKELAKITEYVYTGKVLTSFHTNEIWNTLMIGALLEVLSIAKNEQWDYPFVTPQILVTLGDCNSFFSSDSNIPQLSRPSWMNARPTKWELCMISADYTCVICKDSYDSHIELRTHVMTHTDIVCNQCNIQFGIYEELLAHKLTFCRVTVLLEYCDYCDNKGIKCLCFTNQHILTESIRHLHLLRNSGCPIYDHFLYSMVFSYFCEMKLLKHGVSWTFSIPIELIKESQEELNKTNAIDLLNDAFPSFTISKTGKISCSAFEIFEIDWILIKSRLKQFFPNFPSVLLHQIEVLTQQLNGCFFFSCVSKLTPEHVFQHKICPFSRGFNDEEIPQMHLNEENLMVHVKQHHIDCTDILVCKQCKTKILPMNEQISIEKLFDHAESHNLDPQIPYPSKCQITGCDSKEFLALFHYVSHYILVHAQKGEDVFSCIKLLFSVERQNIMQKYLETNNFGVIFSHETPGHKFHFKEENDPNKIKLNDKKSSNFGSQQVEGKFTCQNENHETEISFQTLIEKKRHLISHHSCPVEKCSFFAELDTDLLLHFKSVHERSLEYCVLCKIKVTNLKSHILSHPTCNACQNQFYDLAELQHHEPTCMSVADSQGGAAGTSLQVEAIGTSLQIDNNQVEVNFIKTMNLILESVQMQPELRLKSQQCISKFAAETSLTKGRNRCELISNRRSAQLFFDIPNFKHTTSERSNLQKILQTIGHVSEGDKFSADSTNAIKDAVENFECIDNIVRKVDRYTQIGFLNESQAMLVFGLFLSQRVTDEISSFLGQTDFKHVSFRDCIQSVQFVFVPLKLDTFLALILNYRINIKYETFLSFSSRVTRHLTLCSRVKPENERKAFIEMHRRGIFKQNLPTQLLDEIERKEQIFTNYTSGELLEIIVSFLENNSYEDYSVQQNLERYKVYSLKTLHNNGIFRKPAGPVKNTGFRNNKHKSVKQIQQQPEDVVKKETTPTPSEASQKKLKILRDRGVQFQGIICFACLGPHLRSKCPFYNKAVPYSENDKLCTRQISNNQFAFGFHPIGSCKHGDNPKHGKILMNNKNKKHTAEGQGWKPYKN